MSFPNLGHHCPATMTVKTQAGIIRTEHQCNRPKDHQGPHRSKHGLIWVNHLPPVNNVKRIGQ